MHCWILAKVDVSGAMPIVVSVDTYSDRTPTTTGSYRWWALASGEGQTYGDACEMARQRLELSNRWALPWLEGECNLREVTL